VHIIEGTRNNSLPSRMMREYFSEERAVFLKWCFFSLFSHSRVFFFFFFFSIAFTYWKKKVFV
jgi:hypothetical protein